MNALAENSLKNFPSCQLYSYRGIHAFLNKQPISGYPIFPGPLSVYFRSDILGLSRAIHI